jgi:MFS family permease
LILHFFIGAYATVISALYFFLPLYLKDTLGFSGAQIGLLYGVLSLNSILVSFPLGVTGDRYPARILTRLGLVGTAASLWALSWAQRFWPFLALFWCFGLSLQFWRQSLDVMLFKGEAADATLRFGHFNAWRMGGMTVGILWAGISLYFLGFPITLRLFGLGVVLLLAASLWLPQTRPVRSSWWQYGRDFLNRPVLFFAVWLFLFTTHWGAEGTSLGLFLKQNLHLGPVGIGFYMAGEFAIVALTAYGYGRFWAGKLKPLGFLALALVTSGVGHILMTYPSLPWSFFWRAVHGLGDGLILMETYTTISRLFHVDRIGGNSGLISLVTTLGVFTGSLIFGPLGASIGYQWPLIISGVTSLALLPMAYWGLKGQ